MAQANQVRTNSYDIELNLTFVALLKALVDKLIPGLSNTTRILLVSQIEEELATEHGPLTVLEHVIQACEDRQKIIKEYERTYSHTHFVINIS